VRSLIERRLAQGAGPDERRRARSWFTVDLVGEGGGERVHTRVRGRDPGYTETAVMLGESALSLAFDEGPATAGQVTPAAAMGENLLARLTTAGVSFSVVG
jgi:saccharopine dehydrogenase (NAD+, L-glutamate forming)